MAGGKGAFNLLDAALGVRVVRIDLKDFAQAKKALLIRLNDARQPHPSFFIGGVKADNLTQQCACRFGISRFGEFNPLLKHFGKLIVRHISSDSDVGRRLMK